ncbi:restriction endonuclease subunit S [Acinetobacter nosocomialis]|uniref:restriction endonuclease subunit S n=1 Tax=Acinetobacter nosocomialis TaxID=106654 RepID=UPI0030042FBA
MKLIKLSELFDKFYGVNLELSRLTVCSIDDPDGIRYVSRTKSNNGVSAYVKKIDEIVPNPRNTISVALGGSVLESFYQDQEYYSGRDLGYLVAREELTIIEHLYYCYVLKANAYKYSYGRQANKTLSDTLIPDLFFVREAVKEIKLPKITLKSHLDEENIRQLNTLFMFDQQANRFISYDINYPE